MKLVPEGGIEMQQNEASGALRVGEVELQHEGHRLDAACALYVPLMENKRLNPVTPSPRSIDTQKSSRGE